MTRKVATAIITLYALLFFVFGAILIFAPDEVARGLFPLQTVPPILLSLLGAALFGFGEANWLARQSLQGGIYGRALVMGNLVHFVVGSFALIRYLSRGAGPTVWCITAVWIGGAMFYGMLMFRPPVAAA